MWWRIITIRITTQAASRRSQLGSAFNFSSSMVHEKKNSNVRNVDWMQVKIAQRLAGSWKVYFRHSASAQFGYVVKKKRPLFGGDRRTLDTLHPWTLDMYILIELESKPDFTVVMMMMREEVQWKKQEVRANTRQEWKEEKLSNPLASAVVADGNWWNSFLTPMTRRPTIRDSVRGRNWLCYGHMNGIRVAPFISHNRANCCWRNW